MQQLCTNIQKDIGKGDIDPAFIFLGALAIMKCVLSQDEGSACSGVTFYLGHFDLHKLYNWSVAQVIWRGLSSIGEPDRKRRKLFRFGGAQISLTCQ